MPTLLSIEALEADKVYVERQLADVGHSPWGTARVMWQHRLADINSQISALAINRSNYARVAVIFDGKPVVGSGDIQLDFTTKALDSYQKVVSTALALKQTEELPRRGPLRGVDQSHLFIRDLVRGSMGFILEEIAPEQHAMIPTPLKDAVESAILLLTTMNSASDDEFESALGGTQPRLVTAVQKFASVLFEAGASTRILGDERRIVLSADEIGRLSRRLSEVDVTEVLETVNGVLLGVLPESREFELKRRGEDAATIKGSISEALAHKYTADAAFIERLLLKSVSAEIRYTRTMRSGRLLRERRLLETLVPIS